MKTTTKVLIGVGVAGVAGFAIWRLFKMGEDVGEGDLVIPDTWGGWDTTTNDGNGATWGPKKFPVENMPTEQYAQPTPLGALATPGTTPAGPDYVPDSAASNIARAFTAVRKSTGSEANSPYIGAALQDPCAGVVCPPNHVCAGIRGCIPIE